MKNDQIRTGRRLTHDELKAAEAAFQGWPFDETWSQAARMVYAGILAAKIDLAHESSVHGLGIDEREANRQKEVTAMKMHPRSGSRLDSGTANERMRV